MANPNKVTRERLERLTKMLRQELIAFQISVFLGEPIFGVVDVGMFGLRFKLIENTLQDDAEFRIIPIVREEDIDTETIFLALVEAGYLKWLRERVSSHAYLKIISYNNRWSTIIDRALTRVAEQKKGRFLREIAMELRDKPLMQIYHEDPTVFDWLLR